MPCGALSVNSNCVILRGGNINSEVALSLWKGLYALTCLCFRRKDIKEREFKMVKMNEIDKILVVSSTPNLVEMVKEAVDGSLEVIYASDHQEGLDKARKELPAIIVLGYIEPQGTAFELHNKLREGWITKNIPLLVVDLHSQDPSRRVLSMEEGLQIEADEYIALPYDSGHVSVSQLAEPIARLREKLSTRLRERANALKDAILAPDSFCITWEQVPGRGAFEMQQERLIEDARRAAKKGKVHAVSVTDNPSGNPAISTEILCTEVKKLGIEPLVHLAFRDKNRNQCESLLYGLAALGVRNLLLLTGDYPCLLYTSPSPRDLSTSRMPSSA